MSVMAQRALPAVLVVAFLLGIAIASTCFCDDPTLCARVQVPDRREVFAFQTSQSNWPNYDWSVLTTVAAFDGLNTSMICHAHASKVKISVLAPYPKEQLHNDSYLQTFIAYQLAQAQEYYLDGLNFDFEDPLNSTEDAAALTHIVATTATVLKQQLGQDYQVSVDVAWSPNCIDGRCYDYVGLAAAADLLFVMSYDMRSQVFPPNPCIASANSPLPLVLAGMSNWTSPPVAVQPSKLILGLPWYGYVYTCLGDPAPDAAYCPIASVPFRGANCSDAAGYEVNLSAGKGSLLSLLLNNATRGYTWNASLASPFFNYVDDADGSTRQVWVDDDVSTGLKVDAAARAGWRGVGVWHVDALDYTSPPGSYSYNLTQRMWGTLGRWYTGKQVQGPGRNSAAAGAL